MVKSPEIRVMSPKMFSQFARNAEFFGSKFIMLWQNRSIRITICRACFVSLKIIERDILLIHRACFVGNPGLKIEIFTPLVSSYGGPQLSRQNQKPRGKIKIPHDKTKNLTTKPNTSQQKPNTPRQKQIPTARPKLFCFCCEVFGFAVRFLVLPWCFCFCRDSCGPPYSKGIKFQLEKQVVKKVLKSVSNCLFSNNVCSFVRITWEISAIWLDWSSGISA